MTTRAKSERLDVGATIDDRYELVHKLGEGGFAVVFTAKQVHLDRHVAVKVLNASLDHSDKSFEARFLQEAKIVAQLQHPNVVTIHDFGFAGELRQPYIAMELLQGHDLAAEIRRGTMAPSRAIPLFLAVLDALGHGHRLNIIHKDLKPANLFIAGPGTPTEALVVLDYGIARWNIEEAEDLTAVGDFTGTPQYVAPEYAQFQTVTPAIDVYQIALVLIEALTQERAANAGNPVGNVMRHVAGKLDIPDVVRTSGLWPLLSRALSVDPTLRPRDAAAFAEELSQFDLEELDAHFQTDSKSPDESAAAPHPVDLDTADALAPTIATVDPGTTQWEGNPDRNAIAPPSSRRFVGIGAVALIVALVALALVRFAHNAPKRAARERSVPTKTTDTPSADDLPQEKPARAKPKARKKKRKKAEPEFSL